jgi:hypothetical protein
VTVEMIAALTDQAVPAGPATIKVRPITRVPESHQDHSSERRLGDTVAARSHSPERSVEVSQNPGHQLLL